jgi:translation initiation factor 2B subunit (eIF-2B alpha/beta/delta family)
MAAKKLARGNLPHRLPAANDAPRGPARHWRSRVRPASVRPMNDFATDRTSGSTHVGLALLEALERWLAVDRSASVPALQTALVTFLREAQAAQPTMALVHQLAARAVDVVDAALRREDSPAATRDSLMASCTAERDDLAASNRAITRLARELVTERESWIATLSSSETVREALLQAHEAGRAPRALIGEGRPRLEGREMAAGLAAAGIPIWLVADAALPFLLGNTSMVWLGADAVTENGVINKIGSYAAALAARDQSVPVYALASRRKFLPAATPALRIVEQPPAEIWEDPPEGVRPRNVYFEMVPMALLRGIVVEDGVLGASEAATVARERPLPESLLAG